MQAQDESSRYEYGAVALFWCRGLRSDVLQGVDRRHLHSFTPDADSRYITRTDPGHTFEAYGVAAGVLASRWQDGTLLGRYVAAEGDSVVQVRVPDGAAEMLPHPTASAAQERGGEGAAETKTEL